MMSLPHLLPPSIAPSIPPSLSPSLSPIPTPSPPQSITINQSISHSPVKEIYQLKTKLLVDVLLRHLRVHLGAHHESQEKLIHQLKKTKERT